MFPEPIPLEEACKHFNQISGCTVVENHIPGRQSECVDISNQNTSQYLLSNAMDLAVPSRDIGESTPVSTDILINNEKEAREIVECASRLMAEQKAKILLSNLDTAIDLFRRVLEGCSPTHPFYFEGLKELASALGVRFMYTNQISDVEEICELGENLVSIMMGAEAGNDVPMLTASQEDEKEMESTSQHAKGLLAEFKCSTSLVVLNTVIHLVEQALPHSFLMYDTRMMGLTTLVDGLHARQHHSNDKTASDLNQAISELEDAIRCCTDWEEERQLGLQIAALSVERFVVTGDSSDLQSGMAYLQTYCDQENTADTKLESAKELYEQFFETGNLDDLNDAIDIFREVIANIPQGSDDHTACINDLAVALSIRFDQEGQTTDLDEAISLNRQALELRPVPHPDRSATLSNLANALNTRFEQEGEATDLDEAITLNRQALELRPSPHPDRSTSLINLASALNSRFDQGGQNGDLEEAMALNMQALELVPLPHPDRPSCLSNLATILTTRFEQGGQTSDLDEAISLLRQTLELRPLSHPNRSGSLNNLARAMHTRFEQGGQTSDLDEAIALHRQALELQPALHPLRDTSLINLAGALSTRFQQKGQTSDLDEVIALNRQALELQPSPHPDRSLSLNNLAIVLSTRFEQGGQTSDLDEAISLSRQAVELQPFPHPLLSSSLDNLARTLTIRFEHGGQTNDLDEAIALNRQALELQPALHPLRPLSLNNLASALTCRFEQEGQTSDLDEAISLNRQVVELLPFPHPHRSNSLTNLAIALTTRFEQGDETSGIDEAIALNREALELRPFPYPDRSSSLINLSNALAARFTQGGQTNDLNESIVLLRQALELLPLPHPLHSRSLGTLAGALHTRFEHQGQQSDLEEAMLLFSTATQSHFQPPSECFDISRRWIRFASKHQHHSLIAAYSAALQILPRVAALSLTLDLRQKALISGSDGLARDASRCAILLGDVAKAVEFLEAGRSVFWSQVLSLRSPFDQLREILPDGHILAARLQQISQELERGSHRQISAHILDNRAKLTIDQESSRLNRLAEEWNEIVSKVRTLSEFEDFLLPPRISSLQSAASRHPIVLLVANDDESHCLVMLPTHVHHIHLRSLPTSILKVLVENVRMASSSLISRALIDETRHTITQILGKTRGISYQDNSEGSDGIFKFVLKLLWDEVVKPVIDCLHIKKHSDEISVLQWCPTGHFTFLPIHAAGVYKDDNSAIDCATDYFISSYIPTIGILMAPPSPPSQTFKMMTIIQPHELPSTTLELQKIQSHLPDDALMSMGVPGSPAHVETVASRLSDVSIVHFACHGYQDPANPLDSWLKLDDGRLQISRVMKEKMPNGALAFLSACETAMGDEQLPDEAMSLAACLLFSGFRRVVATMWMMMDKDGPTIADAFYRELFHGPDGEKMLAPDVTKSAYALHVAVQELRSQQVSFRRWVPFIHMGKY